LQEVTGLSKRDTLRVLAVLEASLPDPGEQPFFDITAVFSTRLENDGRKRSALAELDAIMLLLDKSSSLDPKSRIYELAISWVAKEDNVFVLRSLCTKSGACDSELLSGNRPLGLMADAAAIRCVRLLLAMGADTRSIYNYLNHNEYCEDRCKHIPVMLELVRHGAPCTEEEVDHAIWDDSLELVEAICAQGMDITSISTYWVYDALLSGNSDIAVYFLRRRATPTYEDLAVASKHGLLDIARDIIAQGVQPNGVMGYKNALSTALDNGQSDIAILLLNSGATWNYSHLVTASKKGLLDVVRAIVAHVVQPNEVMDSARALSAALNDGHSDIAVFLLNSGATCTYSHLVTASKKGLLDTVRTIIAQGVQPNEVMGSESALSAALEDGHSDIAVFLLNSGATCTYSHLITASRKGHISIVRTIIAQGVHPNALMEHKSALYVALQNGHADVSALLIESGDTLPPSRLVYAASSSGLLHYVQSAFSMGVPLPNTESALLVALENGHVQVSRFILSQAIPTTYSYRHLVFASKAGLFDIVHTLICQGMSVHPPNDWDGTSALGHAILNNYDNVATLLQSYGALCTHIDLRDAVERLPRQLDLCRKVADAGVNIKTCSATFHKAIARGGDDIVELFVQRGAEYPPDSLGRAARAGLLRTVQDIISGPEEFSQSTLSEAMYDAFYVAATGVAEFLLDHGALCSYKTLQEAAMEGSVDIIQNVISRGVDVNDVGVHAMGGSALFEAARRGYTDVADYLVEQGATFLPSDLAVAAGERIFYFSLVGLCSNTSAEYSWSKLGLMQTMLASGVSTNLDDPSRLPRTPLQSALYHQHLDEATLLISHGADGRLHGNFGMKEAGNALQIASKKGYVSAVKLLLEHGARDYIDLDDRDGPNEPDFLPPLQLALDEKHDEIAVLLLQAGADVTILKRPQALRRIMERGIPPSFPAQTMQCLLFDGYIKPGDVYAAMDVDVSSDGLSEGSDTS
jgi:ankyrin repeat protein